MEVQATNVLFKQIWEKGATWSVEVKQPMLQVARDYTPLPRSLTEQDREEEGERERMEKKWSLSSLRGERDVPPELKFLIRKMDGGEVSTYLSGLGGGDKVELRGPHYGFDVNRRLGDAGRVVFLAGGTGIAPALQVVKALLDGDKRRIEEGLVTGKEKRLPKVDIIWANRRRDDCRTCPRLESVTGKLDDGERGRILDHLAEIQKRYPGRVSVRCTVDEERSFIDSRAVEGSLMAGPVSKAASDEAATDCWLHSQEAVAWRPATDIDAAKIKENDGVAEEDCRCIGGSGKNLLFVSGPEGFVEHFAGPKRWAKGAELQGPVGGVLGKLRAYNPDAMKDWLVLKL